MAKIIPGDREPIRYLPGGTLHGPHETDFTPTYGAGGLADDHEARTHQLSLLVEVNAALAGALDVESVLGSILSRLADRERLTHARIYRLDEPAGELQRVAAGGRNGASRRVVSLKGQTLLAWVIGQREAVYVPLVKKAPDARSSPSRSAPPMRFPCRPAVKCWGFLMLPRISRTESAP